MANTKKNSIFNLPLKRTKMTAIALALGLFALPACTTPEEEVSSSLEEEQNVTTEEIDDNLTENLGETVTIRGEVAELIGDASFLMDDNQLVGGEEILIFNASGMGLALPEGEGTQVQVTGELQELIVADLETEYGLDLDPELYADYEDRAVVVAESIALSPDPGELAEDPSVYYGQRIAVEGEVEDIIDVATFTLDEEELFGGEDVLVLADGFSPELDDGEVVTVTGTLRPYVQAEFEREYDLTWDLDLQEQIEAEYENRPVFVADGVYPSAER